MAWLIRIIVGLFQFFVNVTISSVGLCSLFETAALPLHKTGLWPLTYLGNFVETRQLKIGHVLCVAMLICVWVSLEQLVHIYGAELRLTNTRRLIWAGASLTLLCDCAIFWFGISNSAFFGDSSELTATIVTALYVGTLILAATWVNQIRGVI